MRLIRFEKQRWNQPGVKRVALGRRTPIVEVFGEPVVKWFEMVWSSHSQTRRLDELVAKSHHQIFSKLLLVVS